MTHRARYLLSTAACALVLGACNSAGNSASKPDTTASDAAAHQAHANYVRVINSNNTDSLMSMVTEDVVYMESGSKPYVGKAVVRPWIDGYFKAFHTTWDKPVDDFVVSGDVAYERYHYTSTDVPVAGGKPIVDTGWGFIVYRREADGVWRVARDAWGPDHPPVAAK